MTLSSRSATTASMKWHPIGVRAFGSNMSMEFHQTEVLDIVAGHEAVLECGKPQLQHSACDEHQSAWNVQLLFCRCIISTSCVTSAPSCPKLNRIASSEIPLDDVESCETSTHESAFDAKIGKFFKKGISLAT
jgi:hypothetical protein